MISNDNLDQLTTGKGTVYTNDGEKLGSIGELYVDDTTGDPSWVTVNTGLFGTKETFVPLREATIDGNDLRVPYDKTLVRAAPSVKRDGHLSPTEEEELYRHYSVRGTGTNAGTTDTSSGTTTGTTTGTTGTTRGTVGHDTSGPTTDEAMTRSKEELRVGTERREVGRARPTDPRNR